MSKKTFEDIFNEEIDKFIKEIPAEGLVKFLSENSAITGSLSRAYNLDYDHDNEIPEELWKFFTDSLGKLITTDEFKVQSKEVNCKLYAVKQFSKVKLAIADTVEQALRFELKKYFAQLSTENGDEFMEVFFDLPFEFVSLVIRYLANVKYKDKKAELTPLLKTAETYFHELIKTKNHFILDINDISQGKGNVISIKDMQDLLDTKAFYEYNPLNVGALEFIIRTLVNPKAKKKLESEFGKDKIEYMRQQALLHPSYIKFLEGVRDNVEKPYFTTAGSQNKERDNTYDELVMQYYFPDEYIPEEEKVAEPAQTTPVAGPEAPAPAPAAPTAEQPSPEELLKQPETPEATPPVPPPVPAA